VEKGRGWGEDSGREMRAIEADWLGAAARAERERAVDADEAGWEREVIGFAEIEAELTGEAGKWVEYTRGGWWGLGVGCYEGADLIGD
jgi:hypothetical protein